MLVIETLLNRAAEQLGIDPAEIRRRNFYGPSPRNRTPYDQEIIHEDNRLERIHGELLDSSNYAGRRGEIEAFNAGSKWVKRGIGFQPVKFGISFTNAMLNQAGALVHIFTDGSVQLNHGGTEMGQGLYTKMLAIASHELGIPIDRIRHMNTSTDKVPNTSATAASSGSDLNGQAVADACQKLCERLRPIAAKLLDWSDANFAPGPADIVFEGGRVHLPPSNTAPLRSVSFDEVVLQAYIDRISMSATGYYATPDILYDSEAGRGKPFHYYAYGGAVAEVEISGLTGEFRMTRLDILHDVGNSLVPTIDRGQIEGGYIQGFGWLTCEELVWDDQGHLRTYSPDTYKIPAVGEAPEIFNVALLQRARQHDIIHGSKAVGEPPLMLAISAVTALRHAIASFSDAGAEVQLHIPCTPEAVLRAVMNSR
jgi:xanthine dehydrogenase large subunit